MWRFRYVVPCCPGGSRAPWERFVDCRRVILAEAWTAVFPERSIRASLS